jgi:hypothetical protein
MPSRPVVVSTPFSIMYIYNTTLTALLQSFSVPPTPSPLPLAPSAVTTGMSCLIPLSRPKVMKLTGGSIDVGRNVCHGSDSVENAKKVCTRCPLRLRSVVPC